MVIQFPVFFSKYLSYMPEETTDVPAISTADTVSLRSANGFWIPILNGFPSGFSPTHNTFYPRSITALFTPSDTRYSFLYLQYIAFATAPKLNSHSLFLKRSLFPLSSTSSIAYTLPAFPRLSLHPARSFPEVKSHKEENRFDRNIKRSTGKFTIIQPLFDQRRALFG